MPGTENAVIRAGNGREEAVKITIRELLARCLNADEYAVKVTTSLLSLDLFVGDVGEPVLEHILDNEVARWYLPDGEDDALEIFT